MVRPDNYNQVKKFKKILKHLKVKRLSIAMLFKQYHIGSTMRITNKLIEQLRTLGFVAYDTKRTRIKENQKYMLMNKGKKFLGFSGDIYQFLRLYHKNAIEIGAYPFQIVSKLLEMGVVVSDYIKINKLDKEYTKKQFYLVKESKTVLKNDWCYGWDININDYIIAKADDLFWQAFEHAGYSIRRGKVCILGELKPYEEMRSIILNKLLTKKPLTLYELKYPLFQKIIVDPQIARLYASTNEAKKQSVMNRDQSPENKEGYQILL